MRSSSAFAFASSSFSRLISLSAGLCASAFACGVAIGVGRLRLAMAAVAFASFACAIALAARLFGASSWPATRRIAVASSDVLARPVVGEIGVEGRHRPRERCGGIRRIHLEHGPPVRRSRALRRCRGSRVAKPASTLSAAPNRRRARRVLRASRARWASSCSGAGADEPASCGKSGTSRVQPLRERRSSASARARCVTPKSTPAMRGVARCARSTGRPEPAFRS